MDNYLWIHGVKIEFKEGMKPKDLAWYLRDIAQKIQAFEAFTDYINSTEHVTAKLTKQVCI